MDQSQQWKEYKAPDGRPYFYHAASQKTQWTKPQELMTPAERAQTWKEYTAEGGRKYWYNTETKASTWEMPEAFKTALSQASIPQKPPTPSNHFVAGGGPVFHHHHHHHTRHREDSTALERHHGDRHPSYSQQDALRSSFLPAASTDPDYSSYEEAEAAFMKLLKRSGVQPDWTWEQTMRATVNDPQYRSLKDAKDRKSAFEKFVVEAKAQGKEREKERMAKLREDFNKMLRSHPEIKHFTRWNTARPIIEGETIFRSTNNDAERRQLFEEYVQGLKKAHAEQQAANRKSALDDLTSILNALNLEPYTRWADAQKVIDSNERFRKDDKFRSLSKSDVLTAFENHIKSLERTFNDARQADKTHKARRERRNRDEFIDLLGELKAAGKIGAGTKWMNILPLIENDPRYVAVLGQPGSTPVDLFWDKVEEAETVLRGKRNNVLDVLDDLRYEITPDTPVGEFLGVMAADRRTSAMDSDDLKLIFSRLREKVMRRNEEDKHHAERAQRRAIDALRSRIKHLEPPVRAADDWERDVRPRIERFEEFQALESDELRKSAFEKVIRRLREKEADSEHFDRTSRAERDRKPNGDRRGKREYSRTPERDPYEADRRKAIADRERQYRKSSNSGRSPASLDGSRRRDGRDSFDPRDRYDRGRLSGLSPYGRERRERDVERERSYNSRADPRDGLSKELDYGESGRAGSRAGGTRKRRESEDDDARARDSKRVRKDASSKTPAEQTPAKEEERALRSGSEEGEIEED